MSLATPNSIGPANISYNESLGQLDPRFNNPGADLFQYDPDFGWVIVTEEGAICGGGAQWLGNPDPDTLAFLLSYSFALGPCGYHQFTPEQKDAAIAALAAKNRANYVTPAGFADATIYRPYGIAASGALVQALGLAPHDLEWASVYTIQSIGTVNNLALQDRFTFEWLMNHYDLWKYPKVVEQYNALLPKWDKWGDYEVARVDDSFHVMDLVAAISWGWGLPLAFASIGAAAGVGAEAVASGATALEAPAEASMLEAVAGESSIFAEPVTVGETLLDSSLSQALDVAKTLYKIESTFASQTDFPTLTASPIRTAAQTATPVKAVTSAGTVIPGAQILSDAAGKLTDSVSGDVVGLVSKVACYVTESGTIVPTSQIAPDDSGVLIDRLTGETVHEQAASEATNYWPWLLAGVAGVVIIGKRKARKQI